MDCGVSSEPATRSIDFTYCRRSGFISGSRSEELGLHPPANPYSIGNTGVLADRVQEHDHHRTALDDGLHHEATARFSDVARLLDNDVPGRVVHERIGIAELEHLAAHADRITGVGRIFPDDRV